jgi:hypothetical protein
MLYTGLKSVFFMGTDELIVAPIRDTFSKMPVIELRASGIVSLEPHST